DLWAAGAVLYEMATGQRPFPQTTSPLLINAILNQAPESARRVNHAVLSELDEVIRKCLGKDPASRYQTASDLALALELVSTSQKLEGQHAAKPALAVLPLGNLSPDPDQ